MSMGCDALPELSDAQRNLITAAREAERAGRRVCARTAYEELLHGLPRTGCARLAAALFRWIGRSWFDDGDLDAASDCLDAALAAAEAMHDEACAAHALNLMATIAWRRGRVEHAEGLYLRARELATRGRDPGLVAMIEQNLGIIANMQGDFPRALRRYSSSLAAYRQSNLNEYIAPLLNNMGMLHMHERRWRMAERAYAEALDACSATGDLSTRIVIEVNRTELRIAQRDWGRARSSCDTARALMERSGDMRALGETHKHYGVIERERENYEAAAGHLTAAMDIAEQTQDHLLMAETAREHAELFWRTRRNSETLQWLTRAHRLFTAIQARPDLADVDARLERLEQLFLAMVKEWGESIESKDHYTRGHCDRVADYACALADALGYQTKQLFWFRLGAFLHDVGKLVVPSEILNKPGQLSNEERAIMERHPLAGVELLSGTDFPADIVPMVRSHHERWDGTGYPDRLPGERIPLAARILCVADVYDALTTDRPYRRAFDRETALGLMSADCGRMFDPDVFATFVRVSERLDPAALRGSRQREIAIIGAQPPATSPVRIARSA